MLAAFACIRSCPDHFDEGSERQRLVVCDEEGFSGCGCCVGWFGGGDVEEVLGGKDVGMGEVGCVGEVVKIGTWAKMDAAGGAEY